MKLYRFAVDTSLHPIKIERLDFNARETAKQFITEPMTTPNHQFLSKHIPKDSINHLEIGLFTGSFFRMWRNDTNEAAFIQAVLEKIDKNLQNAEQQLNFMKSDRQNLKDYLAAHQNP